MALSAPSPLARMPFVCRGFRAVWALERFLCPNAWRTTGVRPEWRLGSGRETARHRARLRRRIRGGGLGAIQGSHHRQPVADVSLGRRQAEGPGGGLPTRSCPATRSRAAPCRSARSQGCPRRRDPLRATWQGEPRPLRGCRSHRRIVGALCPRCETRPGLSRAARKGRAASRTPGACSAYLG
jgi:hypothetical protein